MLSTDYEAGFAGPNTQNGQMAGRRRPVQHPRPGGGGVHGRTHCGPSSEG